jgi:hypothetical protein
MEKKSLTKKLFYFHILKKKSQSCEISPPKKTLMGALFSPFPHPTVPSPILQVKPMDGGFTKNSGPALSSCLRRLPYSGKAPHPGALP